MHGQNLDIIEEHLNLLSFIFGRFCSSILGVFIRLVRVNNGIFGRLGYGDRR